MLWKVDPLYGKPVSADISNDESNAFGVFALTISADVFSTISFFMFSVSVKAVIFFPF